MSMAALTTGKGFAIVSLTNKSIVLNASDNNCTEHLLEHPSTLAKDESEENQTVDISQPIVCSALSHNGNYFICCVHKDFHLWDTKNWNLIYKGQINRSASAVVFTPTDDKVAVADKSGNVFLFSVENIEKEGELILGHISMLLDVLVSPNNKYIITCDRDEKIRISCYPNAYNIMSFCLGHEEFVTCLNILPNNDSILVSGSGDGTLRLWDYVVGKQLLCHLCNEGGLELLENKPIISKIASLKITDMSSYVCTQFVSFEGILIYNVCCDSNSSNLYTCTFKQHISMESEPLSISINGDYLWVLKQNIEECLTAFIFSNETQEFALDSRITLIKGLFQKHVALLENDFKKERVIGTLYKRRFDNVQKYLKRKMIRIETNSKKPNNELSPSLVT